MIMPKKSGKAVYDEIKRIKPNVKVIFVMGILPTGLKKRDGWRKCRFPI